MDRRARGVLHGDVSAQRTSAGSLGFLYQVERPPAGPLMPIIATRPSGPTDECRAVVLDAQVCECLLGGLRCGYG